MTRMRGFSGVRRECVASAPARSRIFTCTVSTLAAAMSGFLRDQLSTLRLPPLGAHQAKLDTRLKGSNPMSLRNGLAGLAAALLPLAAGAASSTAPQSPPSAVMAPAAQGREAFRVGDLVVDVGLQRVTGPSGEIVLPKLSFDLLLALRSPGAGPGLKRRAVGIGLGRRRRFARDRDQASQSAARCAGRRCGATTLHRWTSLARVSHRGSGRRRARGPRRVCHHRPG